MIEGVMFLRLPAVWFVLGASCFAQSPLDHLRNLPPQDYQLKTWPTDPGSGNGCPDPRLCPSAKATAIEIHPIRRACSSTARISSPAGGLFEWEETVGRWTDADAERVKREAGDDPHARQLLRAFAAIHGLIKGDPRLVLTRELPDLVTIPNEACPPTIDRSLQLIPLVDPEAVYPPLARQARIQGQVRFEAIIGIDGRVKSARLISGHPLLVPSARQLLIEHLYQPFTTEVHVLIDVGFTLVK